MMCIIYIYIIVMYVSYGITLDNFDLVTSIRVKQLATDGSHVDSVTLILSLRAIVMLAWSLVKVWAV